MKHTKEQLMTFLIFAKQMAQDAGFVMEKHNEWDQPIPDGFTYINEYVADLIERHIDANVKKSFPKHSLFMDGSSSRVDGYEWICDYVDGAYGYSKWHKISVTSIALTYNGETVVAAIYNPWTKTMYSAYTDGGFYVNDIKRPTVSMESFERSLVDVEWWRNATYDVDSWMHNFSVTKNVYVLHIGSVIHAACLVADGVFSAAVLGKHMTGKNHEIAAISLIMKEADCVLTDLRGHNITYTGDVQGLIFANKSIHDTLVADYAEYNAR